MKVFQLKIHNVLTTKKKNCTKLKDQKDEVAFVARTPKMLRDKFEKKVCIYIYTYI